MKRFLSIFVGAAFLLNGMAASADQWPYADNETLFSNMVSYLENIPVTNPSDPFFSMTQEFLVEVKAAHKSSPYAWLGQTQRFCDKVEAIYAPAISHHLEKTGDRYESIRKFIVRLKDYPMHEHTIQDSSEGGGIAPPLEGVAAFNNANRQSLLLRNSRVREFLSSPKPAEGELQVAKLYNNGFIFRTCKSCVGIDLCLQDAFYSDGNYLWFADHLDALLTTHADGDHYDAKLLNRMVLLGKPVIMDKELTSVINVKPAASNLIVWDSDVTTPYQLTSGISVRAAMGAQGTKPCLIYYFSMDGWNITTVGDNSHHEYETFYHSLQKPDVVVAPVFQGLSTLSSHLVQGSGDNPILYLSAHENEYHHVTNSRIAFNYIYQYAYASMKTLPVHSVVLEDGEYFTLSK